MALYVPVRRGRRRAIAAAAVSLVAGLAIGGAAGRASAPGLAGQVREVRKSARDVSSRLRVVSLHQAEDTISQAAPDDGTELALRSALEELRDVCRNAAWIAPAGCATLAGRVEQLARDARRGAGGPAFAAEVDAVAAAIDGAFGVTRDSTP